MRPPQRERTKGGPTDISTDHGEHESETTTRSKWRGGLVVLSVLTLLALVFVTRQGLL